MNFAGVVVIITSPFILAVGNSGMRTDDMMVTLVFIGMNGGLSVDKLMDVSFKGLGGGILLDPKANLPTFLTNCLQSF